MTLATNVTSASRLSADLKQSASFIARIQQQDGAIPWFAGGKLDPWDHTEAAMALSVAGYWRQAELAYNWLAKNQLIDGSWHAIYFIDQAPIGPRETNFIAYIATGVWHHFLVTGNRAFLQELFPCVRRAIECVLHLQNAHGEIAWAMDSHGNAENDALITGCASILRSLDCAIRCAQELKYECTDWIHASAALANALRHKPERFDRTWSSKARFSMDWYYPVLAGLYNRKEAQQRLQKLWQKFVVPELGCRCVCDEPWVTIAETSELIMALVACDKKHSAMQLFQQIQCWRDVDGGYWTGYVYRDQAIWPEEKTSWTAAAVILAADAIHEFSNGAKIFSTPLKCHI